MKSRNNFSWGFLCVLVACVFVASAKANTLFSIDKHLTAVVRAYAIEGNALTNPVTISEETIGGGPVGIAVSEDLGLDLRISSCYNKFNILVGRTVGH